MSIVETLIGATDKGVTDVNGKKWYLFKLFMNDVIEFEMYLREKNKGLVEYETQREDTQDTRFLLWLMLRKNGCTGQEVKERKWPITVESVGGMFFVDTLLEINQAVAEIYIKSGLLAVPKEGKMEKGPLAPPTEDSPVTAEAAPNATGGA